ncbi:MAG: HDOD domain-containing protein [Pseudomonadales bacterium]
MSNSGLSSLLKTLVQYVPFENIDEQLLTMLAKDIDICSASNGFTLFYTGDYDANEYYLIKGSIKLLAQDGRENTIQASDNNCRFPIARLRPRMYTAIATSDIQYFVVSASVLEELQSSIRQNNNTLMVQEMRHQSGEDSRSLLYEFEQELNSGRFVLPSLPEVAFRIHELIDNPDCNIADLAKLVNTDPAITTKLVKVANSVMYRGVNHCDDTLAAISRLGLVTTKQLVTSFAVLTLFNTNSPVFKEHMTKLWKQSVEVAAYSYVLAKHLLTFNEEEALLAGLIHTIGEMIVLTYAERFYDLSTDENHLEKAIINLRGPLGEMVLSKWDFNKQLITVARDSGNWMRESDTEEFDYCDLVQVATLYAAQDSEDSSSLPEMNSVPAFNKLKNRQLTSEQTTAIIKEAKEQIAELRQIFS